MSWIGAGEGNQIERLDLRTLDKRGWIGGLRRHGYDDFAAAMEAVGGKINQKDFNTLMSAFWDLVHQLDRAKAEKDALAKAVMGVVSKHTKNDKEGE